MRATLKTLDQLGYVSRGRSRHRPRDAGHLYGGPYPFIQTGDVKHADLYITSYGQTYSEAGLAQSKLWSTGTLCITIAANIADTAILSFDACFPDSVIGFVPDENRADARFIKYLFDAMLQKRYQKFTQGAAQENLSQEKLLSLQFPVPLIEIQQRVADILAAYDNQIENNRRRIQLLEQSALLLYKEWFVHLRFPGHEHVKVVDGVPLNWSECPIERLCVPDDGVQTGPFGSQLHQSDYSEDGVPVVMPKDIADFRISTDSIARVPEEIAERLSRHKMQEGDVVYGRRGDIGRRAYVSLNQTGWLCGTGCLRLRPDTSVVSKRFFFDALGAPKTEGTIIARAHGVTMPNLNTGILKAVLVLVPPKSLQDEYASIVEPIKEMIERLSEQVMRLVRARDLLLPRLMSGEIEV